MQWDGVKLGWVVVVRAAAAVSLCAVLRAGRGTRTPMFGFLVWQLWCLIIKFSYEWFYTDSRHFFIFLLLYFPPKMYKFAERSISVKTLPCVLTWSTLARPVLRGPPPHPPGAHPGRAQPVVCGAAHHTGVRMPRPASRVPAVERSGRPSGRKPILNRYL